MILGAALMDERRSDTTSLHQASRRRQTNSLAVMLDEMGNAIS
jgi:hypothetical protein